MKKLKHKTHNEFKRLGYNTKLGKEFIWKFIKENRKDIKSEDQLKLFIRLAIEEYRNEQSHNTRDIEHTNGEWKY